MKLWKAQHLLILLALLFLGFGSTLTFQEYVYDDTVLIRNNPVIQGPWSSRLWMTDYWGKEKKLSLGSYRPAVSISFWLEHKLFGLHKMGYHLVQLLWMFGICILVGLFSSTLGFSDKISRFSAYFFCVLAIHTEVIASITGRADMMMTFFFLLAMVLHRKKGNLFFVWTSLAIVLGLCSKEFFVLLVPALFLMDSLLDSTPSSSIKEIWGKLRWKRYFYFALLSVFFLITRFLVTGSASKLPFDWLDNPLRKKAFLSQVLTAPSLFLSYVSNFFLPLQLSFDKTFNAIPVVSSVLDRNFVLGLGLLALFGLALFLFRKTHSKALLLLLFGLTYLPVSNLLVITPQTAADRWFFLPSVFLAIWVVSAFSLGLEWVREKSSSSWFPRFVQGMAVLVVLSNLSMSSFYAYQWRSFETLLAYSVKGEPNSLKARYLYGKILFEQKRWKEALNQYNEALRIYPEYIVASHQKAKIYEHTGNIEMAQHIYFMMYQKYNKHKNQEVSRKVIAEWKSFLQRRFKAGKP